MKIDDLSDATGIVQNDLSVKTAIPRSYQSHSCLCDSDHSHSSSHFWPRFLLVSQPRVQTRSRTAHIEYAGASVAGTDKDELPHVTTALESDCDMSQWHIARISHKSSCKCHAQQAASKGTLVPTYRDRTTQYGGNKEIVTDFWFCPDDIERCMKYTKRLWVLDWP
jgi:hypothetical protein